MIYKIQIKNWKKYQTRHDLKMSSWFRLENAIYRNQKLYSLNDAQKWFFVIILCCASEQNNDGLTHLDIQYLKNFCTLGGDQILSTLRFLVKLQVIEFVEEIQTRNEDVTSTLRERYEHVTLQDKTRQNKTRQNIAQNEFARQSFDFEKIYKSYPRKIGKERGLKTCKVQIKTQNDYDALKKAVYNYAEFCKKNCTEAKYIKHFSTFMASWKDWLDPETGSSDAPTQLSNLDQARILIFGEGDS